MSGKAEDGETREDENYGGRCKETTACGALENIMIMQEDA